MNGITHDTLGFRVDGKDAFLVSGEFHYFRVPKSDWRRRMELFKQTGGNCVATYVPWLIHEPTEGDIRFGDIPERDLCGYLQTAAEVGLKVILRPGPYQYSELDMDGLPRWLVEQYPEVLARNIEGRPFRRESVSYLHPTLLEKARAYYRAFAEQVRPYLAENGGPVSVIQVDNELGGIHIWFGSRDYHPVTMGFGRENGRYPTWLRQKYGEIGRLNEAYGTAYACFADVRPVSRTDLKSICACRISKDYADFYRSTLAEYVQTLTSWLREDGIHTPICHNAANPNMNALFRETVQQMEPDFLLGTDNYYTLNQSWPQNSPTPQYALRTLRGCETLRELGMPPAVLEMPGGSPSDTPPILKEDLLACYMTNLALGMKGVNYYIYTGGPNFADTGATCDIYDYNAIVHADGSLNPTYETLKTFNGFLRDHGWMQRTERKTSVQVGFEWSWIDSGSYDFQLTWDDAGSYNSSAMTQSLGQADTFLTKGVLYTLMCSRYAPKMVDLEGELSLDMPLIVPCASAMSEKAQKNVADFVAKGGRILILPVVPEYDADYRKCSILADALGSIHTVYGQTISPAVQVEGVGHVFGVQPVAVCNELPEGAEILARDSRSEKILGFEKPVGAGRMIWFGGTWEMSTFPQAAMLERMLERLGAKPCVVSSNRSIFTALWQAEGRQLLFAMNLYSGVQSTELRICEPEQDLGRIDLKPMEVRVIELS